MPDFVQDSDDGFNHQITTFLAYASAHTSALGLSGADLGKLTDAFQPWFTTYPNYLDLLAQLDAARVAKDDARGPAEAMFRQFNGIIQANPDVTDESRAGSGLPVHKAHRTPVGPVDTHPVLFRVDNEHLLQRLWFSDSATPGKKAKPRGVAFCEIRQVIQPAGMAAPTNPAAMPLLATDSKSPHRTDLEPEDAGKVVYYAQRWVNTRQEPGPWSQVTSYPAV